MRKVKVNPYQVALVFKDGMYKRLLKEGEYWLWSNQKVIVCDFTKPFEAPVELNILLQDAELADMLYVVEVKDNEIVLLYKNGLLESVLAAGRYTYSKSVIQYDFVRAVIDKIEITENIGKATLQSKLVAPFVRSFTVENYEKALLFVDGTFVRVIPSGVYN